MDDAYESVIDSVTSFSLLLKTGLASPETVNCSVPPDIGLALIRAITGTPRDSEEYCRRVHEVVRNQGPGRQS